ncbi:unnamed protein product [Effrenium voratum]|nr:unnamed protein product [Effrenium voratum]
MVGTQESKRLSGLVTLVTGASRGIGKGIAQSLAEAGAIVYVTGRSAPGKETDIILMGTVDETASTFQKLGGTGVAVHVDHAQDEQNSAIVKMIRETHGRLDILVNSAFYIPKPDMIFFTTPVWNQPMRFLNEQTSVGGLNHIGLTVEMLPFLRRGRGVVLNISSWGSQMNIPIFPLSYYCNKATFDRSMMALAEKVRNYGVCVLTVWPGSVKSERSIMGAKRSAARLIDLETTRFTGPSDRRLRTKTQKTSGVGWASKTSWLNFLEIPTRLVLGTWNHRRNSSVCPGSFILSHTQLDIGQNETTRNWTAGCSPSVCKGKPFWIPMFDSLTHSCLSQSQNPGKMS